MTAARLRHALPLGLALLAAAPLSAQREAGDSAWTAKDYPRARLAYQHALEADTGDVRALFRLSILVAWDGNLDSSLTLLEQARRHDPQDADIRWQQGTVLAWSGRYDAAIALYDSLLAEDPGRQPAALMRARTLSWAGRLDQADQAYAGMIARDSTDVEALAGRGQAALWSGDQEKASTWYLRALELDPNQFVALVGMAQVRQNQLRPAEASSYIDRALAVSPDDRDAIRLAAEIDALARVRLDPLVGWNGDSDDNSLWWQSVTASIVARPGLLAFGTVGFGQASDPFNDARKIWLEAGGTWKTGRTTVTGALGLRSLSSDTNDTFLPTWRIGAGRWLSPRASAGLGYSRYVLDETAVLIDLGLHVDEVTADGTMMLQPRLTLSGGLGYAFFSDGNRRPSAVVSLMRDFARDYSAGVYGRVMGYQDDGYGYFSPDLFWVAEGRGSYTRAFGPDWRARLGAGLGLQQAGTGNSSQFEYHFEARVARQWNVVNEVALSGLLSNSLVSSTTGAYRYYALQLSARIGL